jgi:hypothetical protein
MAKQRRSEGATPSRMKDLPIRGAVFCAGTLFAAGLLGAMPAMGTSAVVAVPRAFAAGAIFAAAGPQEKKDYLTDAEGDKIRDATDPNDRVKLYLFYASDRLKKFEYEVSRTVTERKRDETLNGLLNAYSGCVDDAADLVSLEIDKGADIRLGLREMIAQGKGFLADLDKIKKAGGPELDIYKDNLDDALEGTQDAVTEAETALKSYTPPVRRKVS